MAGWSCQSPDGYEQTIRGVLAHLGLADYQGPVPAPQPRRQSNDLNEAWVAAYLTDRTTSTAAIHSDKPDIPVLRARKNNAVGQSLMVAIPQ
jgi:hypothetical protein